MRLQGIAILLYSGVKTLLQFNLIDAHSLVVVRLYAAKTDRGKHLDTQVTEHQPRYEWMLRTHSRKISTFSAMGNKLK